MSKKLLPCPSCGRQPKVYHGYCGGLYGDSIECDNCYAGDPMDPVLHYTDWDEAVRRWNDHAAVSAILGQANEEK